MARSYQSETISADDRERKSNKLELENTLNLPIIIYFLSSLSVYFSMNLFYSVSGYLMSTSNINLVLFSFIKLELKTLI